MSLVTNGRLGAVRYRPLIHYVGLLILAGDGLDAAVGIVGQFADFQAAEP